MQHNPPSHEAEPGHSHADIKFVQYDVQQEAKYLDPIRTLISKDLSEPYGIYVYRYFLYQWAQFCYMVRWPSI
jgi:peptide alpha-N-acetyltransferase